MPGAAPRGAAPGIATRACLVLGLGNLLNRDEGVGVRLLELLYERIGETADVEFIDGGVMGLELLPFVERSHSLLVLDAVDAAAVPGSVIELRDEQVQRLASGMLTVHQLTFHDVLALAAARDRLPAELRVVGVQPGDTTLGTELSPAVAAALGPAVAAAARVLAEWRSAA